MAGAACKLGAEVMTMLLKGSRNVPSAWMRRPRMSPLTVLVVHTTIAAPPP
jgi:hypothetical protein